MSIRHAFAAATLATLGPLAVLGVPDAAGVSGGRSSPPVTTLADPFVPEQADLGDCVSALPRPDCGTDHRSGAHQYLTFIVLLAGTAFVGWRVVRGVRLRDRVDGPAKKH